MARTTPPRGLEGVIYVFLWSFAQGLLLGISTFIREEQAEAEPEADDQGKG